MTTIVFDASNNQVAVPITFTPGPMPPGDKLVSDSFGGLPINTTISGTPPMLIITQQPGFAQAVASAGGTMTGTVQVSDSAGSKPAQAPITLTAPVQQQIGFATPVVT